MFPQAAKFARVLTNYGVKKGDRVILYMPMVPEVAKLFVNVSHICCQLVRLTMLIW